MNILFITIGQLVDINSSGLYTDLLRQFKKYGHEVFVITAREKRMGLQTEYLNESGFHFLRVRIGNITKCGVIEKGISTVFVERQYINAIKRFLPDVRIDLVIYTTPPISFVGAVEYVKKRDESTTYLLLKDIFPQNAVDIGLMSVNGIKGLLYKHFRNQEKKLYRASDHIGCMSQANVDYVIKHNSELDPNKIEVCPNTTDPIDMSCTEEERNALRTKYGIPLDRTVFVYGGNLGKPQGIPFIIECLKECQNIEGAYFLIVGDGTEYQKLARFVEVDNPQNVKLMKRLPKEDYDKMIGSCDVGLIFLDHRFTIPNFPSRLLSYMTAKLPVLACTDINSDIGKTIVDGGFGWWCESNNSSGFVNIVELITSLPVAELTSLKECEFDYLSLHFSSNNSYRIIIEHSL